MSDDPEVPESGAGEPKPPKTKAEDNPWYLLATLYGVPEQENHVLQDKNRIAWNRYFAANFDEEARIGLIEEKRHTAEELTTFSSDELQEIERAFAKRKGLTQEMSLPASGSEIDFSNVQFEKDINFDKYLFKKSFFSNVVFSRGAVFNRATFASYVDFGGTTFSSVAHFWSTTFSNDACFEGATFRIGADFSNATFSGLAIFDNATFSGPGYFVSVTFSSWSRFRGATFNDLSWFINAEMKGVTSFVGAQFRGFPPEFFGAKLHEGTIWRAVHWPKPKHVFRREKFAAWEFVDAYERLKLEMDRLKKHEDELNFFALELQWRRVLGGRLAGLPITFYGISCDYGRSFGRPLLWLVATVAAGAWAFWYFDALKPPEALGFSAANTLNLFGFRKDFFDAATIAGLLRSLKLLAAIQTILGAILLFLVGLGIRNKFRMK
jgi:Pentapeptide repeats (9 copies)